MQRATIVTNIAECVLQSSFVQNATRNSHMSALKADTTLSGNSRPCLKYPKADVNEFFLLSLILVICVHEPANFGYFMNKRLRRSHSYNQKSHSIIILPETGRPSRLPVARVTLIARSIYLSENRCPNDNPVEKKS